jgi:hypothetical protein
MNENTFGPNNIATFDMGPRGLMPISVLLKRFYKVDN